MCDTMQVSKNDDEAPIRCVSISDKCYLISLWYCYEDVIEWHRKRVMGELNKYPTDHDWTGVMTCSQRINRPRMMPSEKRAGRRK